MLLVVSTCETSLFPPRITQLNPHCLAGSTLPPLTMNGGLFEAVFPTGGRYWFVHTTLVLALFMFEPIYFLGLFFRTSGWPCQRDSLLCHIGRYDPNKLSSGCNAPRLLTWALTVHNLKLWELFSVVSTPSNAFPVFENGVLIGFFVAIS